MTLKSWLTISVALACSACSGVSLSGRPTCPPLTPWSQFESNILADEINEYGWQAPYINRAVREYRVIRQQCTPEKD